MRRYRLPKSYRMHLRSKRKAQSAIKSQPEPVTAGAPKAEDKAFALVRGGVYWIRLADPRLSGSAGWQIARQCLDNRFMVIGMLVIVDPEDVAEIGPLVSPPGALS